jgi:hypothetical protein
MLFSVQARLQQLVRSTWLIFGVALVLRLAFLMNQAHLVPREALATVPFQNEVGNVAAALAQGQGFCCLFRQATGPTAWLVPVYPLLVAGIFKIWGSFTVASFYVAAILNCLFSALTCFPLFYAGRRVGGSMTGVIAAWLWAFFPSGIIMPFEWIWDTCLSALLAASLLWATLVLAEDFQRRNVVLYGMLWGFSLLVNPALGAVFPFLLLWIYLQNTSSKRACLRGLMVSFTIVLVLCLPWTIRNAAKFHRFIPMRSNFPFELWMGNNPIYDENSRQVNRITRYEQVHLYSELGETEFLETKWKAAKAFIYSHPGLCLKLAARRCVAMWMGTPSPWQDFLNSDSILVRFVFVWNGVTLLGAIAGLGCLFLKRRAYLLPFAAFPVVFPMIYYVTQASLRLRHPCDPALALLLALAVRWPYLKHQPMQAAFD